jgi:hypothetical protein
MTGPSDRIEATVRGWPGAEVAAHRFGGIEFRYRRRELGHLHGDRFADLPVGRRVKDELIAAGRARPHHVLPDTGWVTVPMGDEAGEETVLELLRSSYDRAVAQAERRTERQRRARA